MSAAFFNGLLVTVPGKPNDDLGPGTLNSFFKQAGLRQ
jgi:predicted RNA binding protein YcfA (HicA-like mRNA interferase family)